MYLSVSSEAAELCDDGVNNRRVERRNAAYACTTCAGIITLVVLNMVILVSVGKLRGEYREKLAKLESHPEVFQRSDNRQPANNDEGLQYECLYAVGGGAVRATGGFPQYRLVDDSKPCQAVFDWYFASSGGQYWADLDAIGSSAISYLTVNSSFVKGDSKNMVVFDIDETLLSNLDEIRTTQYKSSDSGAEKFSPALKAIKDVYLAAYNYGMSVALITGRSESDRVVTQDNLAAEGFGRVCPQKGHGNVQRTDSEPCYVALHMRDLKTDKHKLASVFKPERRKQLQDAGYTLVATFGDQYSDLEGLYSAIASYKIPNPMYYIL